METGAGDTPRAENGLLSPLVLNEGGSRHELGVEKTNCPPCCCQMESREIGALETPSAKALSLLLVLKGKKVVDSGAPGG